MDAIKRIANTLTILTGEACSIFIGDELPDKTNADQ